MLIFYVNCVDCEHKYNIIVSLGNIPHDIYGKVRFNNFFLQVDKGQLYVYFPSVLVFI